MSGSTSPAQAGGKKIKKKKNKKEGRTLGKVSLSVSLFSFFQSTVASRFLLLVSCSRSSTLTYPLVAAHRRWVPDPIRSDHASSISGKCGPPLRPVEEKKAPLRIVCKTRSLCLCASGRPRPQLIRQEPCAYGTARGVCPISDVSRLLGIVRPARRSSGEGCVAG